MGIQVVNSDLFFNSTWPLSLHCLAMSLSPRTVFNPLNPCLVAKLECSCIFLRTGALLAEVSHRSWQNFTRNMPRQNTSKLSLFLGTKIRKHSMNIMARCHGLHSLLIKA